MVFTPWRTFSGSCAYYRDKAVSLELVRMTTELAAEKTLRTMTETDHDHWRKLTQKLAEPCPRIW